MDNYISQDKEESLQEVNESHENKNYSFEEEQSVIETNEGCITTKNGSGSQKFFYTEIMSTAGPRKDFKEDAHEGDYDLGEDVVGCFTKKDKTYFWLLDGTSDNPIVKTIDGTELFSSRLLAQEAAWHIQKILWDDHPKEMSSSIDILELSFQEIQKNWNEKFNKLSESDKQALLDILKEKKQMVVSSTVIFGIMNLEGDLDISRIGDSYIITNPVHEFEENTGRLFVIAFSTEDNESIKIAINSFEDTRCQHFERKNINTLIIASDGISKNTIRWLNIKPIEIRNESLRKTISAIKQKTCDDKAMCIIQICNDV